MNKKKRVNNPNGRPNKLTPIEEIEVYNKYIDGITITEIAFRHGISSSTVSRIVRRIKKDNKI